MFHVSGSAASAAEPISLADAGLKERDDLQGWVVEHSQMLGEGVRIVTFEFDRWNSPDSRYEALAAVASEVDAAYGPPLSWEPGKKTSRVADYRDGEVERR